MADLSILPEAGLLPALDKATAYPTGEFYHEVRACQKL
jgi:hypothetical protein